MKEIRYEFVGGYSCRMFPVDPVTGEPLQIVNDETTAAQVMIDQWKLYSRSAEAAAYVIGDLPLNEGQRKFWERDREAMSNEWRPFTGEYEKQFYEAKHPSGTQAIKHLWPNAGILVSTNGTDLTIRPTDGFVFRRCTCGHKYGGCTP